MVDLINFYRVQDLNSVREFYEKKLELKLYKDQGKCLIYETPFGKLGFCNHFPEEISKTSCITFVYNDKEEVNEIYSRLKDYSLHSPQVNDYFKIYHFFIIDPNGLKLEFQHFL